MKSFLKNIKIGGVAKKIGQKAAYCWSCHQQAVFIIAVLISVLIGAYFWYESLYNSDWNEDEKKQFLLSQEREINLKEGEFKKVVEGTEKRKKAFESEVPPIKDIFKAY